MFPSPWTEEEMAPVVSSDHVSPAPVPATAWPGAEGPWLGALAGDQGDALTLAHGERELVRAWAWWEGEGGRAGIDSWRDGFSTK